MTTYTAGNDTFTLDTSESPENSTVPMFCKSTANKFIHVGDIPHDQVMLSQKYEIDGELLYIELTTSANMVPLWVRYRYQVHARPMTDAERDAKIMRFDAHTSELDKLKRFMRVVRARGDIDARNLATRGRREIRHDAQRNDTCYVYVKTIIIIWDTTRKIDELFTEILEFENDLVKIEAVHFARCYDGDKLADTIMDVILACHILPNLNLLEIGLSVMELVKPTMRINSRGILASRTKSKGKPIIIGYKHFEAISQTGIKCVHFGIMGGSPIRLLGRDNPAIIRLTREKNITVIINGSYLWVD